MTPALTYWQEGNTCCNPVWEKAYARFETEVEEIHKFSNRLKQFGAKSWPRTARIVDLFCGSGRNLKCLETFGFSDLHGVDLSPMLLKNYTGKAKLYVGDAKKMEFPDEWADIVIVQGGLHHLPDLFVDLPACLDEIRRVVKSNGMFVMVEPWRTPFLDIVHWCCRRSSLRLFSNKLDALAIMIQEERGTYMSWLANSCFIDEVISTRFKQLEFSQSFGKALKVMTPKK
jgi:ubiquinone/menaquinone biosynthesis C-methylase UbiE